MLTAKIADIRRSVVRQKADRHVAATFAAQARVAKALDDLLAANAAAERVYGAAQADLASVGCDAALYVLPSAFYVGASADSVDGWKRQFNRIRNPEPPPPPAPGFLCRVLHPWGSYMPEDVAFLPESVARMQVEAGRAEWFHPADVPPDVDPRKAAVPEPDAGGRVRVVVMRQFGIGDNHPDAGGYRPGDIASMSDLRNAERLVRSGHVQFVNEADVDALQRERQAHADA